MEDFITKSMWNIDGIGFSFSDFVGFSGGIIILWKEESIFVQTTFKGEGLLGIKVVWKNNIYNITNIYSSCDFKKS